MSEKKSGESLDSAHEWLAQAADQLDQDPAVIRELTGDLLDLTRDVAHGPSRPAAPLTAFLVGLASGRELGADAGSATAVATVRSQISQINELLEHRPKG